MQSQPYGLSPVELNIIYVTFGAGKPLTYTETGMMVSSLFGNRVKEADFFPRFVKACSKGLVTLQGWDDLDKGRRERIVVSLPKCVDMIRDVQIAMGGEYHYYKYFDPYEDYEKNPHKMDRFLKGSFTMKGQQKNMDRRKLFDAQYQAHKKDPKNYRWF